LNKPSLAYTSSVGEELFLHFLGYVLFDDNVVGVVLYQTLVSGHIPYVFLYGTDLIPIPRQFICNQCVWRQMFTMDLKYVNIGISSM
jgi:hypothetical protein